MDGSAGQSKSDKPADEWLPLHVDFCWEFVSIQIAVRNRYERWVTAPEFHQSPDS